MHLNDRNGIGLFYVLSTSGLYGPQARLPLPMTPLDDMTVFGALWVSSVEADGAIFG